MKKIFLAIAVLGIVLGALAFSQKKCLAVCASNVSGGSCNVLTGITEVNNGHTSFARFVYCNWDGTQAGCSTGSCTTPMTLYIE